jgi:hypothetical protein
VEAGVSDRSLDKLASRKKPCPVLRLSRAELRDQVKLIPHGLLGRGASALCFKCVWPNRFGEGVLAAKVLKVRGNPGL